jgi:hypothetical protein
MTVVLVAIGSQLTIATNARAQCASAVKVQKADEVLIRFDMTAPPIKRIDPSYFGFNIEWPGFQADLWNSDTGQIHPDVAMWLKRLNGAIYRYPGGTVANYFKWRDAIGSNRKPQKAVDWTGPIRMDFGIEEYFRFLRAVDGKAWLVANMYGEFRNECPIDSRTTNAADFADAADKQSLSTKIPVVRWELGNELDRGTNGWSAEKYAANANSVAAAIRTVVPNTKFVAIWPDYDAYPGVPAAEYARRLSVQLDPAIDEFAQHMYFDGPTGGPPVPNRLEHMCKLIDTAKAQGKSPSVWVSEFARWPPGKPSDPNWKFSFPLTANLSAAISNADFLIGTTQIREVRGGMIHSLASSKGPWPMFHRHGEHFNPSTVMLSLVLLRQSLVGDVLPTDISSPYDSRSNNPLVRAVSVISPDKQTLWITLVNRGDTKTATQIAGTPSPLFSQMRITRIEGLHDQTELASNYEAGDRVAAASFSNQTVNLRLQSNLALDLLPNSITVLRLDRQQ